MEDNYVLLWVGGGGGGEIALTEISAAEDVLLLKKFEVDQNCMHTYIIIVCGCLQP